MFFEEKIKYNNNLVKFFTAFYNTKFLVFKNVINDDANLIVHNFNTFTLQNNIKIIITKKPR